MTTILRHRTEKTGKCSVAPLRGRPDLRFHAFPLRVELDLTDYVRLGIGGPVLSAEDRSAGLLILDASWRHVKEMEVAFSHVPVRGLPPLVTAFPRASKLSCDPAGGLATVEALYAALALLGRKRSGLLDQYRWGDEFLAANPALLREDHQTDR